MRFSMMPKRVVLTSMVGLALAGCGMPPAGTEGSDPNGGEQVVSVQEALMTLPCTLPYTISCNPNDPKIGSCHCAPPPRPPSQMGTVTPSFYVTHVVYAPPGKSSSVSYSSSTSVGSTTSVTKSFKTDNKITAGAGFSVPMTASADLTVSVGSAWGNSSTDQTDVQVTYTQSNKAPGETDPVDHDYDQIWFLIHPLINVTIWPAGQVAEQPEETTWQFAPNQDGVNNSIKFMAYAGWLTGRVAMPPSIKSTLDGFGITTSYYGALLMADPLAWGEVPNQVMDPSRYDFIPGAEYPFVPPLMSGDMATTQTKMVDQKMTNTSSSQVDLSYTVSATESGSASFLSVFKASLSVSESWTWGSSSNKKESTGTGSTDTLVVGQPAFGYSGPNLLHVWEDKIYKTYAFSLDVPPGQPMMLGPTTKETYTTGDFNGDGKTDMIVTSSTGSDWYFSTGPGTWTLKYRRPDLPLGAATFVPGDFNGDGKTDVIITTATGSYWYFSNGDGTWTAPYIRGDLPLGAVSYVPGDFNGDGKTDVIILTASGSYWYFSNGNGTWTCPYARTDLPLGSVRYTPGDFNGDHRTDVIIAIASGSYWYYSGFTGNSGSFSCPYSRGDLPLSLTDYVTGDFNGDGRTDVIITIASGSYWYFSQPTPGVFTAPYIRSDLPRGAVSYATADFDGNGKADVLITTNSGSYWYYSGYTGDSGAFSCPYQRTDMPLNTVRYTPGDFSGDKRSDVIITNKSGSYWYIAQPTAGAFSAPYTRPDLVL
jgi:FG-GAP-like repeat